MNQTGYEFMLRTCYWRFVEDRFDVCYIWIAQALLVAVLGCCNVQESSERKMRLLATILKALLLVQSAAAFAGLESLRHTPRTGQQQQQLLRASFPATTETSGAETSHRETLSLFSPCKINLFLRIIRKRPDGFHDLASLFQAIGFGDTLELTIIENAEKDEFTCNMSGVPTDSTNLVLRALQLMREKTGVQQYYKANLIKQVPAQAGLGGGSANAATAMWGANELMGRPASLEQVSGVFIISVVFSGCLSV